MATDITRVGDDRVCWSTWYQHDSGTTAADARTKCLDRAIGELPDFSLNSYGKPTPKCDTCGRNVWDGGHGLNAKECSNRGGEVCLLVAEVTKLRAENGSLKQELEHSYGPHCSSCGNPIDPEYCWCGSKCSSYDGHSFVNAGCICSYATPNWEQMAKSLRQVLHQEKSRRDLATIMKVIAWLDKWEWKEIEGGTTADGAILQLMDALARGDWWRPVETETPASELGKVLDLIFQPGTNVQYFYDSLCDVLTTPLAKAYLKGIIRDLRGNR